MKEIGAISTRDSLIDAHPKIRVLLTKIGLDGHDRGYRLVATALRDAGMEVIMTAPWTKVEEVVSIANQEDVDLIGISSLSCDHLLVPKLMKQLRARGLQHVRVIVGGIVPDQDVKLLQDSGVARIFHPGATLREIVGFVRTAVERQAEPSIPEEKHV